MGEETTETGRRTQPAEQVRERLIARLRALMAHTVVNGATADEELMAARMVAKMIAQLDGTPPPPPAPSPARGQSPPSSWAQAERDSPEYRRALERNVTESLFKAAVQELALNHINTVSPPRRRIAGEPVERVTTKALVQPHLAMMLAPGGMKVAQDILGDVIEELIQDGALPPYLDIPLGD